MEAWKCSGSTLVLYVSLFAFSLFAPAGRAHIGDFDEVWQLRAKAAREDASAAFHPNPEEITDHFNKNVRRFMEGIPFPSNSSMRRSLRGKKYTGPCMATNPIDSCWRCKKDWAQHRKKLARCAMGFGAKATGGKAGKMYVVTDPSDGDLVNPKPGTLRHGVIQKGPLWITFARSMVIKLQQELIMTSDKTIDGRGANVRIAYGAGIMIQFIRNVIIHGLHIHDVVSTPGGMIRDSVDHFGVRTASDGDGISIFGSTNIWIDHISMSNCQDGLIDVIMASTAITISNSRFTSHNDVMLFGGSNMYTGDKIMQITLAFNHFGRGLVQRMPRCRYGLVHIVNNHYRHWLMYAVGGSQRPAFISQGNRYVAPHNLAAKEVTKREYTSPDVWRSWTWISQGDLLLNGAFFVRSGDPKSLRRFTKTKLIKALPGTSVPRLTKFSGAVGCHVGRPC